MRIDKTNTPYRLASDVAEIIKTLRSHHTASQKFHRLRHTCAENQTLRYQTSQQAVHQIT